MFGKAIVRGLLAVALVCYAVAAQATDVFNMGGTRDTTTGTWTGLASLEFVSVGDPGNARDVATVAGAVAYNFNIGKYDVTTGQYCQFLNAVAKTDPYGLYYTKMASGSASCGILRSGESGSYTYSLTKNGNYPVNYISWGDAARFCNWLQNGQPTGDQGPKTTETGAYALNGATSDADLMTVTRSATANFFMPSLYEWYKAAYYKGGGTNAGYWAYQTQSNTAPGNSLALAATEFNNTNYYSHGTYTDPTNYLTPVGAFAASPGHYGTYDMGGNVFQWTDANLANIYRRYFGGSFRSEYLSTWGGSPPSTEISEIGFRVASSVPEPGSIAMLAGVALTSLLCWWRKRA